MSRKDRDWESRLSAWFDGECSELDGAEVRRHLMESPEARARLREWRDLRADLQLLQPAAPSAATVERMRARFEDGIAHEVYSMSRALRWWNVAAAALLVLGLGLLVVQRIAPPTPQDTYASQPSAVEEALHELLARPPAGDR